MRSFVLLLVACCFSALAPAAGAHHSINFGLLGDFDALPDLADIAEGIEASLEELLAVARRTPAAVS